MIEIAALLITLCIPYAIVVLLLVLWNQESPPSTVEDTVDNSKHTIKMLSAHKGNLEVQVEQLRSALDTVNRASSTKEESNETVV